MVIWRQHLRSDSKTVTGRIIYRSKADNGHDTFDADSSDRQQTVSPLVSTSMVACFNSLL